MSRGKDMCICYGICQMLAAHIHGVLRYSLGASRHRPTVYYGIGTLGRYFLYLCCVAVLHAKMMVYYVHGLQVNRLTL